MNLVFDLETSAHYCTWDGLGWVSVTFCSRRMGQHLSVAPRAMATLTFDLGGLGACPRYRSSCSVCVVCTKFEVCRPSRSEDITHFL